MDNANLDTLPLELRENIASLLEGQDLCDFRLISKGCEEGSRKPFAQTFFSYITVFVARVSLERLCAICANPNIGPWVKRIDFVSRRLCRSGMDIAMRSCYSNESFPSRLPESPSAFQVSEHVDDRMACFRAFAVAFTEQQCMIEWGAALTMLTEALTEHAKHDKPLILGLCDVPWEERWIDPNWNGRHGIVRGLGFEAFFGKISPMDLSLYYSDEIELPWQDFRIWALDLLLTASRRHNSISRLVVDVNSYNEYDLPDEDVHAQSTNLCMTTLTEHSRIMDICAKLHSLKLTISPKGRISWKTFLPILSCAHQLQELSLNLATFPDCVSKREADSLYVLPFCEAAQSCPVTCKLTTFALKESWVRKADLIDFLRNYRETLVVLDIRAVALDKSWDGVLEWMKNNLPALRKLRLRDLYIQDSETQDRLCCTKVFSGSTTYSTVEQAIMEYSAQHHPESE